MPRRARLTVLESGASPLAWASTPGLAADDWIVVAQQSDEPAREFTERVRLRARRLRREDADIESVDVYAGPRSDGTSSEARRSVIQELGEQLAEGGRLTLWSASQDAQSDAELAAILAQFAPTLAARQIAVNHQSCEPERSSGVRHAVPLRDSGLEAELDFDEFG